jgi:hypothetical protein
MTNTQTKQQLLADLMTDRAASRDLMWLYMGVMLSPATGRRGVYLCASDIFNTNVVVFLGEGCYSIHSRRRESTLLILALVLRLPLPVIIILISDKDDGEGGS